MSDPIDLGGDSFAWEVATAIAGAVLGIDPFDQPNVEEAKELTRRVLSASDTAGRAARDAPLNWSGARDVEVEQGQGVPILADGDGLTLIGDAVMRLTADDGSVPEELARHLAGAGRTRTSRSRRSSPCPSSVSALARINVSCATARRAPRPPATGRGSCSTASCTRAGPTGWFIQLTSEHAVRSTHPGLAVHVRPGDRRPGRGRLRGNRDARSADPRPPRRRHRRRSRALERALEEALSSSQEN